MSHFSCPLSATWRLYQISKDSHFRKLLYLNIAFLTLIVPFSALYHNSTPIDIEAVHVWFRCFSFSANTVCVYRIVSHYFPGDHHWSCQLSGLTGRSLAKNQKSGMAIALPLLVQSFRRQLWDGRSVRAGDGLSVRYQLERIFTVRGQHYRPAAHV